MNAFGDHLIQPLTEAVAHGKGQGTSTVHESNELREVRQAPSE